MVRWFDPSAETELPHRSLHGSVNLPVRSRMPQLNDELARLKVAVSNLGLLACLRLVAQRKEPALETAGLPVAQVRLGFY